MVFGSVDGAIRTLNRDGALGTFIESSEEIKDDLTLQLTYFLPQPASTEAVITLGSNELLYGGSEGFFKIGLEVQKSKKRKPIKTLLRIGDAPSGKLQNLKLISERYFLATSREGERWIYTVMDTVTSCSKSMEISTIDSPVLTAFPGPDESLMITRQNGVFQIYQSPISCSLETQLPSQIVSFANTSNPNVFLVGTTSGVLAVAKITSDSFSIIESMKVFKTPLTSIAIDPFSRAFIVASNKDDKIIVATWNISKVLEVVGYLPVDGIISSITVCSQKPNQPLYALAAISQAAGGLIDGALSFELSPETMKNTNLRHLNKLKELD